MKSDIMLGLFVTAMLIAIAFGVKTVAKKSFNVAL